MVMGIINLILHLTPFLRFKSNAHEMMKESEMNNSPHHWIPPAIDIALN